MLINKNSKIVANASQPTLFFASDAAYAVWLTDNGLTDAVAKAKFDIIIDQTDATPKLFLAGHDCTFDANDIVDNNTIVVENGKIKVASSTTDLIISDASTGTNYKLVIEDGVFGMEEVTGPAPTGTLTIIDSVTEVVYKLTIANGVFGMEEI